MTRRDLLMSMGAAALFPFIPGGKNNRFATPWTQIADAVAQRRAQIGAAPIVSTRLADNLAMLSGPGGNVIVLNGSDGKLVVDTFVQPAFAPLAEMLKTMGASRVRLLINTHWHFDHTDNNENFRKTGVAVLAHVKTKKRMSETHDVLGMHFDPSPASALPTQTFLDLHKLHMNGESVEAGRIPPAHTDTDAYVRFARANVLHMGDVFFNGTYPFIDASTGGNINGQIAGATLGLKLSDNATKIVPGHGPLADRAMLTGYRDMMVAVRDRVQKLKKSGRTVEEAIAAKPTAEFDAAWGKGFVSPDDFVRIVYGTLG
jgi:cyclase